MAVGKDAALENCMVGSRLSNALLRTLAVQMCMVRAFSGWSAMGVHLGTPHSSRAKVRNNTLGVPRFSGDSCPSSAEKPTGAADLAVGASACHCPTRLAHSLFNGKLFIHLKTFC